MERYLVVSGTKKGEEFFHQLLSEAGFINIDTIDSADGAKRLIQSFRYDIIIINSPLSGENGELLATEICKTTDSGVLLVVKAELAAEVEDRVAEEGVFVLAKPLNKTIFFSAIRFVRASWARISALQAKEQNLKKQLEDIKLIERAKYCLIQYIGMTEPQAHRHIEKQAMDMRRSKRQIAEDILKTYEM